MDAVRGPIITFNAMNADAIPPRIKSIIPIHRMLASLKSEELATLPEVVCYIFTRTLDAPMDHDWTQIYTYVSCKVCEDEWGEDHWDGCCPERKLNQWQESLLLTLRKKIYTKRIEFAWREYRAGSQKSRLKVSDTVTEQIEI
jgi:hypothetical protein